MTDFFNSLFPFDLIPEQASTFAERVDLLYYFMCTGSRSAGQFLVLLLWPSRYASFNFVCSSVKVFFGARALLLLFQKLRLGNADRLDIRD